MDVLIERRLPLPVRLTNRGLLDPEGQVSATYGEIVVSSCRVIAAMAQEQAGSVEWVRSWICHGIDGGVIFCHYRVDQLKSVHEHGRRGNFPVDGVWEVLYQLECTEQVRPDNENVFRGLIEEWPAFAVLHSTAYLDESAAGSMLSMLAEAWENADSRDVIIESMLMTADAVFMIVHASNEAEVRKCYGNQDGEQVFPVIRVLDPSLAGNEPS